MSKGKEKSSINSSKAKSLLGDNNKAGVATSLWGIFTEFNGVVKNNYCNAEYQPNTSLLHPSFVPIFTNISKKDCSTRLKGLISFKEKLECILKSNENKTIVQLKDDNDNIVFDWGPILSNFTYIYIRVGVYDSDANVRKLSNECLILLHKIVGGRRFEKYCKLFFPALWLSCNDPKPDVSKTANDCLNQFIKKENNSENMNNYLNKIIRLINYCNTSLFDLYGRIISCTIKTIKSELNANVSSQSEEEELFDRLISTSLCSVRKILEIFELNNVNDKPDEFSLQLSSHLIFNSKPDFCVENGNVFTWNTLKSGLIWKYISPSYSSVVRIDAIQLITSSLKIIYNSVCDSFQGEDKVNNGIVTNITSLSDIFVSVISCFGDISNPSVQSVSPKLLLIFLKLFPQVWDIEPNSKFKSPIKYFSKTLYLCLYKPNQISSACLYLELPQIIASIPLCILIDEFKTSDHDYFSRDCELSIIMNLTSNKEFYFESLCDFLYINNKHITDNSLPLICLLPFAIVYPMIKLNSDNDGSKTVFLGASNCSILNKSIETYYTMILFILCNRISNISDEDGNIKAFLHNYYSKLAWLPLIFSLILKKPEHLHNNSSNCHKAQLKINEQFSNAMLDSIQFHNWTIEECKLRKLNSCIDNLSYFLNEYWSKYYLVYLPSSKNNIKNITYNREIYLDVCLSLIRCDSLFFNSILFIFNNSIIELFSVITENFDHNINKKDGIIGDCYYNINNVVYKLFLISKFTNKTLLNAIGNFNNEQLDALYNNVIENYKCFINIISHTFNESSRIIDMDNLYITMFTLNSIFTSTLAVLSRHESYIHGIAENISNINYYKLTDDGDSEFNLVVFVIVMSFIIEKLENKECYTDFNTDNIFSNTNTLIELLINRVFTAFQSYDGKLIESAVKLNDLTIKQLENGYKKMENFEGFLTFNDINIRSIIYNLLLKILKNETVHLNSYINEDNFIQCYIFNQFKYLNSNKQGSLNIIDTDGVIQLKNLIFEYLKKTRQISSEFLTNLVNILVNYDNDCIFEINNNHLCLNNFIQIIDSIFHYSYTYIENYYSSIINDLEISLLQDIFGFELQSKDNNYVKKNYLFNTKMVILIERNAHMYVNHSNYKNNLFEIEGTSLEIIINRLSNIMVDREDSNFYFIKKGSSLDSGFKINSFLRIYNELFKSLIMDYEDFPTISEVKNMHKIIPNNKLTLNKELILSIAKDIFMSQQLTELALVSNNIMNTDFEFTKNSVYFELSNLQYKNEFKSQETKFVKYLISKGLHQNSIDFNDIIKNTNFFLNTNINIGLTKFKNHLLLSYYNYIFELFSDSSDYKNMYFKFINSYLDKYITAGNNSKLLEFISNCFDGLHTTNKRNEFLDVVEKLVSLFKSKLIEFSNIREIDELLSFKILTEYIVIILEKLNNNKIYGDIDIIVTLVENLTKELETADFNKENDKYYREDFLLLKISILSNFIKIIRIFIDRSINIEDGSFIEDIIGFKYQNKYSTKSDNNDQLSLDISKLLMGISSTVHYLVGKLFNLLSKMFVDIKEIVENRKKIQVIFLIENTNNYISVIGSIILNSMHLSSSIYSKLKTSLYDESGDSIIQDDLRFSSVTIPIEANVIVLYDKILLLVSTIYNMTLNTHNSVFDESVFFLFDQILRIKSTEISGREWIMSISNSDLGSIKGNAMEISRLLTTCTIKLHSFVLIILKQHNWHNIQYEYYDLKSAISAIEKFQNTVKDYLMLKNIDHDYSEYNESDDTSQHIDGESDNANYKLKSEINNYDNRFDKMNNEYKSEFSSNFEKGIYVIASHWRRLIGPSLSQQLIETYLSTLNVVAMNVDNSNPSNISNYVDLSQRLGCWCFMLPKLISDDFVICVDSENPNIKTIEKNLTPCIEFLLELKPLLVGEAINDAKLDLNSKLDGFLPSFIEDDDISICRSLLAIVNNKTNGKSKSSSEFLDNLTLKNTTFNMLRDIIDRKDIEYELVFNVFELPLIHALVELSLRTLALLDDYFSKYENNNDLQESNSSSQINWIDLFKHSSNSERRNLLVCNLEEILIPNLKDSQKQDNFNIWNSNNLTFTWLLATRIILSLTTYFPRILREIWLCNTNKKVQKTLQKLVLDYFSPIIIPVEINHIPLIVEELSSLDRTITYNHNHLSRNIRIDYSERGFNATLTFTFSEYHPLVIPKINVPSTTGIPKKQISNWLISVIKAARYKNVTHAILTWINNISLFLEGIEDCLICYSIVHSQYRSLPRKRCPTCKNIFHSECIYKWFRTSNKTTCPFCITIMH